MAGSRQFGVSQSGWLAQVVDELTKHRLTLKSITEPFDTSTAAGKMTLQMLGPFAELEHATIVERTKVGMEKLVQNGKWHGGRVPYGYQFDDNRLLVVREDEAVIVRRIFRMYCEQEKGASSVAHELSDVGHCKRTGKKWDRRVVLHMLRKPLYVGRMRWGDADFEGVHDPIIADDFFNQAAKVMERRSEELKGRQWHNGNERLLAGVARCARCKSRIVRWRRTEGRYVHPLPRLLEAHERA